MTDAPIGHTVLRDALREAGYTENAVAGFLSNADSESGGDPTAIGDGGTSVGLFQWHGPRADAMMDWAKANNLDPREAGTQARWLIHDMDRNYPQLKVNLNAAESPKAAAMLFQREYEKPKVIDPSRGDNAVAAYGWLAKSAPQGAPDAATGQPVQPTSTPTEQVGPVTAVVEAAKEGFGSEPLVPQPGGELLQLASRFGPVAEQAARTGGTAWALVSRAISAVVAGGTEAAAQGAEALGMSETEANQLRRDLPQAADMLMAAGMMTPKALGTKIPTRAEIERAGGAAEATRAPEGVPGPTSQAEATRPPGAPPGEPRPAEAPASAARPGETAPASTQVPGAETIKEWMNPEHSPYAFVVRDSVSIKAGPLPNGPRWLQRLDDLKAPEDVRAIIHDAAAMDVPKIEEARRGTVTWQETRFAADALGMTPEDLMTKPIGKSFNAEEMVASNRLVIEQASKVKIAAEQANLEGYSLQSLQAYQEEILRLQSIMEGGLGAEAEAGRALRVIASYKQSRNFAEAMAETIKNGGSLEDIKASAQAVRTLDDPAAIARVARISKPGFIDKVHFVWLQNILSGLQSQVRNIVGNTVMIPVDLFERGAAELLTRGTLRETSARVAALPRGFAQGIVGGAKHLFLEDIATHTKLESARVQPYWWARPFTPTRWLEAEDNLFRSIAEAMQVNADAVRIAKSEGLKGDALVNRIRALRLNPTDEMMKAASANADYLTFQQKLGPMGQAIQTLVGKVPTGRWIAPFIRTPANIFKAAQERSPAALTRMIRDPEYRAILMGERGAELQARAIIRIAVGTAIMTTAGYAVQGGLITGSGPSDPAAQRLWRTDHQPYSFKVGDRWYSYQGIEPIATLLGASADVVEGYNDARMNGAQAHAAVLKALIFSLENLRSKSFMAGAAGVVQSILDPERYGDSWINMTLGSTIPALVASIARHQDPVMRDGKMVSLPERLQARIPGMSENLPPRYDVLGNVITYDQLPIGWLNVANPIYSHTAVQDPVVGEMRAVGYAPGPLLPHFAVNGMNVDLGENPHGPHLYAELQRIAGTTFRQLATVAMSEASWPALPAEQRKQLLGKIMDLSRQNARVQILKWLMENPE